MIGTVLLASAIAGCEADKNAAAPADLSPTGGLDALEQMKKGAGPMGGADFRKTASGAAKTPGTP